MKAFIINVLEQKKLFDFPLLVIRGSDAQSHEMGDIDVLVPSGMNNIACKILIDHLKVEGWYLISFREARYLSSITVSNVELFPGEALKIDFFGGIEWYGIKRKLFKHEFLENLDKFKAQNLITFLHKVMYGGGFREKDLSIISENKEEIIELLGLEKFIDKSFFKIGSVSRITKWKIRHRMSGYKGFGTLFWALRVLLASISSKVRFSNHTGILLFMSGENRKKISSIYQKIILLYSNAGEHMPFSNDNFLKSDLNMLLNVHLLKIPYLILRIVITRIHISIVIWSGRNCILDNFLLMDSEDYAEKHNSFKKSLFRLAMPRGNYFVIAEKQERLHNFLNVDIIDSKNSDDKLFGLLLQNIHSLHYDSLCKRL